MEMYQNKRTLNVAIGFVLLVISLCSVGGWHLATLHRALQQRSAPHIVTIYSQAIQTHNPRLLDHVVRDTSLQGRFRADQKIHTYDGIDIRAITSTAKPTESTYAIVYDLSVIGTKNQREVHRQDTILVQQLQYWDNYPLLDTLLYYTWFLIV